MHHFDARLQRLLTPRSVAVIGASDDPLRIGGRPLAYMLKQGYRGGLWPVNPNRSTIQGLSAFASVADLPAAPDVAIIAVAASQVPGIVADLARRGTAAAVVFSAGFAEVGGQGAALERQMLDAARAQGMRVLGPNSLGLMNLHTGFYGTFSSMIDSGFPVAGRLGIASQSGAYGTHIVTMARELGIGLSSVVTTGNECDVNLGEIVHAMVKDDAIDVIAVYAEGVRDGAGLVAAFEAARRAHKPIIMMKVGRSEVGGKAAQSHTASIAGNDAVMDAVMAEWGVVRARSTEHMLDVARLALRKIYPVNNSLGVITVSGGAGVIISDAAEAVGLRMPEMPGEAQRRLKELITFASPRNPVDCTAQFLNDFDIAGKFTEAVVADGGYQSVLGFFTHTGGSDAIAPQLRRQLKTVRDRHPDRLFALSVLASNERVQEYEADGFSVFQDPARAVIAIEAMGRLGKSFSKQESLSPPTVKPVALPTQTPSEAQAKQLLAQIGIDVAPERACATEAQAVSAAQELGFPVVMKILSPDILHKSEIGGVLLNVNDLAAVREGFHELMQRARTAAPQARIEGVLVAKQLTGGVECIMGIQRDPVFGPVAMFGVGGIFVEVMKDVVLRPCPFGEDVAEDMIRSIKSAPLLNGVRGKPPVDVKALARMLARLSVFGHQAGEGLVSVDLNPVLALPQGQGAYALDAVLEIRAPEHEPADV